MKKNILFVFSDQQRWRDLGCYGNGDVISPNIDAWAEDAAVLDRFYSNCPVCVPARGTLLTGLFPSRHGAATNDLPVKPGTRSAADILNENGYDTAYIGKWHLGGVPRDKFITEDMRLGFRYWRGCNCNHNYTRAYYDDNDDVRHSEPGYEPRIMASLAERYLSEADKEKPFALFLSFGTPHDPYDLVPPETLAMYDADKLKLRENVSFPVKRSPSNLLDEKRLRAEQRGYYAHITELDKIMGQLITLLRKRGLYENTVIVYTSDHGNMMGSRGFTDKQLPYEEASHIPFIISCGGDIKPGRRSGIASLADVTPTLLSLAGVDISDETFDGRNASDIIKGSDGGGYAYLAEYVPCHQAAARGSGEWRALVCGDYKLILKPGKNEKSEKWEAELYNLAHDPYETADLCSDASYSNILAELREKLDREVGLRDGYYKWEGFIKKFGFTELWNKSQKYFGLEELK